MACRQKPHRITGPVWGATGSPFVPFATFKVNEIGGFRISVCIEARTSGLQVTRAYRLSDDGLTWDTATTIGSALNTANSWSFGSSFTSVANTTAVWIQVGVVPVTTAGEQGTVAMLLDLQEK